MPFWKKAFFEIVLILLLGTVSLSWFPSGKLIIGTDTVVPLRLSTVDEYFYIWSGRVAPGSIDVNKLAFLLPIGILLKGWSILGLPYSPEVYERLLVYILYSGAGLSVYFLYRTLFKNSTAWGRVASAVFAMFNFYVLFIFTPMPLTLLFSYCFFPAVMAVFVNFLRQPSVGSALFFVLMWALLLTPSYTTPPYLILHVLILLAYFLFFLFSERPKQKRRLISLCAISFIVWALVEAFWLVPFMANMRYEVAAYGGPTQSDRDSLQLLNSAPLYNAFRLMGYFGFDSSFEGSRFYPWYEIFRTPAFIVLSFMVPTVAFSGLLLKRKEPHYLFFVFMALAFVFLVKGPYEPLGAVNSGLFRNFNLSIIFRTAYQRFTGFTALAFAVMAAYTLERVFIRLWYGRLGGKLVSVFLFFAFVVVIPAAVGFPIWTGRLFQAEGVFPSQKIRVPAEYFEVADWLAKDKEEFNIFPLPFNGGGQSSFWWNDGKDGYGGIYPFESIAHKGFVISGINGVVTQRVATNLIAGNPRSTALLGLLNVRYVFYHRDSNWEMVNHHGGWISAEPKVIESGLKSLNGLSLVKQFPSIDVYAVKDQNFLPKFYTPTVIAERDVVQENAVVRTVYFPEGDFLASEVKRWLQNNPLESPPVVFQKIDQTKYRVEITKARAPFLLVFSDTFDNGWQFSSGSYRTKANHVNVNGYANAWFLDPEAVCRGGGSCRINGDGSYNLKTVVEFIPQRFFWVSLIVSLSTLAMVMGYLIFTSFRPLGPEVVATSGRKESIEREKDLFPIQIRLRNLYLGALIFLSFLLLKISPVLPESFSPAAYLALVISLVALFDTNLSSLFRLNMRDLRGPFIFVALSFVAWFFVARGYPPAPPNFSLLSLGYLSWFLVAHFILNVSARVGTLVALIMLILTPYYLIGELPLMANATAAISFSLFTAVAVARGLGGHHND